MTQWLKISLQHRPQSKVTSQTLAAFTEKKKEKSNYKELG